MTIAGHAFDICSSVTRDGLYVVTIDLNHPGLAPTRKVSVRADDERSAVAEAVVLMIDNLKGFRTLQRKLIKEAILWL